MTKINDAPLLRLFKIKIKSDKRKDFTSVGKKNLITSIKNEPGTLAMYTTHVEKNIFENRVIEVYKDDSSYKIHVSSAQFKAFRKVAKTAVVEQNQISLKPIILHQEGKPLLSIESKNVFVSLTQLEIKPTNVENFQSLLTSEINDSIGTNSGTITVYLGQEKDDNGKLILFEVFEDEIKYEKHLQTDYFQKFLNGIKPLVIDQQTERLNSDVMVNRGNFDFIKQNY